MEQNEKARYKKWFPFTTYDLDELNNRDIVFCFHHAGGSASVYRKWTLKKEKINFVCVELPGKGTRRKERFIENFEELVGPLVENSTNDFVTKVWGNILTKEIITKSVVPDLLKSIDLKQIKILDYAQELCPPDVKGQVYVSESEIMNDRNKTYYKILEHPLYGRMADTGIIGVLTHDGYMEFVVPNCETSVETPDKKEDTHEEEIEKPIVKEIMKIWKEVFEIEDISIQDDFYTLGGDSIILMRLVDEMCKTLGCDVTVDDILQSENISDLANRV